MIKSIIILMLFLFYGIMPLNAQVFDPRTEWYYCSQYFPPNPESCYVRRFENVTWEKDTMNFQFFNYKIQQVDKKVWLENEIIYDFSLVGGDTIFFQNYFFEIDSVKTMTLFGASRIVQFGKVYDYYLVAIVEGLGARFISDGNIENENYFFLLEELLLIADPFPDLKYLKIDSEVYGPFKSYSECNSCDQVVSIDNEKIKTFSFELNGANDLLTISGITDPSIIQLFNTSGQLLQSIEKADAEVEISLSNQNAGVYFLRILTQENGKFSTLRFVIAD